MPFYVSLHRTPGAETLSSLKGKTMNPVRKYLKDGLLRYEKDDPVNTVSWQDFLRRASENCVNPESIGMIMMNMSSKYERGSFTIGEFVDFMYNFAGNTNKDNENRLWVNRMLVTLIECDVTVLTCGRVHKDTIDSVVDKPCETVLVVDTKDPLGILADRVEKAEFMKRQQESQS